MASNELEVIEAVRDSLGSRRWSAAERAARIAEYKVSGLTQRVFAKREGVPYGTFVGWLTRERAVAGNRAGRRGGLIVAKRAKRRTSRKPSFQEVRLSVPRTAAVLEVRLVDGIVVRGDAPLEIAALVRALRG